jgi:DnaD/phage-associated family protein
MSAARESRPGPFAGFIAGAAATTLPVQLFTELLPEIADPVELRVTLYALHAIQRRRGRLRAVRESELAAETPLRRALEVAGGVEALRFGLAAARARGVLLACPLADGDTLYFINSDVGRRSLAAVQAGAIEAPVAPLSTPEVEAPAPPARVYEAEIGALTPSIAEALAAACERYPEAWVSEALRVAARRNARNWRYAEAVLRGWEAEGRTRVEDPSTAFGAGGSGQGGEHGRTEGTAGGAAGADRAGPRTPPDPYARVVRRDWPLDGARDRP